MPVNANGVGSIFGLGGPYCNHLYSPYVAPTRPYAPLRRPYVAPARPYVPYVPYAQGSAHNWGDERSLARTCGFHGLRGAKPSALVRLILWGVRPHYDRR